MTPLGDYEQRGDGVVTGECAAGDGIVNAGDPFVIRYHPDKPGGIFHQRCDPSLADPMWYPVDGEAPDL